MSFGGFAPQPRRVDNSGISPFQQRLKNRTAGKSAAQGSKGAAQGAQGARAGNAPAGLTGTSQGGFVGDSAFIQGKDRLQRQFTNQVFPLRQQLTQLQAKDPASGMNQAEAERQIEKQRFKEQSLDLKNISGRAGLINSGFRNRTSSQLNDQFLVNLQKVSQSIGSDKITQIREAIDLAKQNFREEINLAQRASKSRTASGFASSGGF